MSSSLVGLTTTVLRAQTPAAAPAGLWQGALALPASELKVLFRLVPAAAGAYTGTLTVPQQGLKDLPFASVAVRADSVVLRLDQPRAQYRGRLSADGQQLGGEWRQGAGSLPLTLRRVAAEAEAAATAGPRRPQTPQAPFPYRATNVEFRNATANLRLAGTLTMPPGKGPFPAVVLVTGSGPQDRDETLLGHKPFWVLADYLTRRGIAVLRYDDRGTGQSGGTFASATSADFTTDVRAALAWLRAQPGVRQGQVGALGHSQGGTDAIGAAIQPNGPDFLVLLAAPGLPGDELLLAQYMALARLQTTDAAQLAAAEQHQRRVLQLIQNTPDDAQARAQLLALYDPAHSASPPVRAQLEAKLAETVTPNVRHLLADRPTLTLPKVKCPVLALGGSKDLQVPATRNLAATAAARKAGGNPDVTTQELPGLNHLFQTATTGGPAEYATLEETFAPAALQRIGDWLAQHTRP